jgi:hypothetical protein
VVHQACQAVAQIQEGTHLVVQPSYLEVRLVEESLLAVGHQILEVQNLAGRHSQRLKEVVELVVQKEGVGADLVVQQLA